MMWRDLPSMKGRGDLNMPKRAAYYANPPSNPGLHGFMLDKKQGQRGHDESVGTGTSYKMVRKGQPMR